jgi:hypothetical protein
MASQVPDHESPNRGTPKVVPGESARRSSGQGAVRGRMSAPAPNNRMPAPHPNQRRPSTEDAGGRSRPSEQPTSPKARNPTGSPTPNQRNLQQPRRNPQPQQRKGEPQRRPSQQRGSDQSNIDESARAALALAAVAQAASASNKSPAEAAEIAKAQAHHIAKKQTARRFPQARPEPRKIQSVNLESVKGLLRSEVAAGEEELKESSLLEKLADGGNDPFLQHLLMIEYLRAEEDDGSDLNASLSQMEDIKTENMKTAFACDRLKMLLGKTEAASNSLNEMMPDVRPEAEGQEYDPYSELDDMEAPRVVPDLLPPCTSKPGDATLEFFKACMGENADDAENKAETETTASTIDESSSVFDMNSESVENKDAFAESQEDKQGTSMLSSMFSMKRPFNRKGFASVFGKKRKGGKSADDADGLDTNAICEKGEYTVQIEREMLGLTVENVLERTVVRTVLPGGPAKKAGAKVGSLIVKVGNIETKNLTHFETIDELRQSQRPLQLVLRQISDEALRSAREEMGRLIRGSGFGKIFDGEPAPENKAEVEMAGQRIMVGGDKNIDMFTAIMRKRWVEAANQSSYSKKDEPILRVGEKLVWILTLFIIGLERESDRLFALAKENEEEDVPDRNTHSQYHHTAKDYGDAAKSVSKVLFDFLKKRLDPAEQLMAPLRPQEPAGRGMRGGRGRGRGGRGGRGMTMVPGVPDTANKTDDSFGERLLLQIGDVLQRTRTFLADPTSPPAAMIRGEVIACLCDILDADSEMKLSEEENGSQTQGGNSGPISDLGSAGSLLKLIVLNCPIMRSPGCEEISKEHSHIDEDELKRRFGEKQAISGSDFHRLHAGNRFLAVVHRLAASRSTSARITACSLGPVLWSHLDFPHQLQVCFLSFIRW